MERIASSYMGVINVGFAICILVGGAVRFPPPTYRPLLEITHGSVWPYGAIYLTSGLLLLVGYPMARIVGAACGVIAHSSFSALFLVAVVKFPEAGATAWWAYLAFASQSAALATLGWMSWRKKPARREG